MAMLLAGKETFEDAWLPFIQICRQHNLIDEPTYQGIPATGSLAKTGIRVVVVMVSEADGETRKMRSKADDMGSWGAALREMCEELRWTCHSGRATTEMMYRSILLSLEMSG